MTTQLLLAYLDGTPGWQSAEHLAAMLFSDPSETGKRKVRQLAADTNGRVAGGEEGYKLTIHLDKDEMLAIRGRLHNQAEAMSRKARELLEVWMEANKELAL